MCRLIFATIPIVETREELTLHKMQEFAMASLHFWKQKIPEVKLLLDDFSKLCNFRLPDPHQAQVAKMMESRMAPCGSGILPLLVCQSPRWRFNKVPLGIPRGSGNLNLGGKVFQSGRKKYEDEEIGQWSIDAIDLLKK